MAFIKVALFLSLLVAVTCASLEKTPREEHDLIDCSDYDESTDTLAFRRTIEKQGRFLQIQKGSLSFPEFANGKQPITCIRVINLLEDGNGGYTDILNGGVTFFNVLFQFTSQRSKGYKFLIEIYTK